MPKTLMSLLTLREFRGYDASLLVLWDVPVLNQCRDRLPAHSDLQGAYPRYITLQLMVLLVQRILSQPSQHKDLAQTLLSLMSELLRVNLTKKMNSMQLDYCETHRKKVYIWNALLMLSPLMTPPVLALLPDQETFLSQFMASLNQVMQIHSLPSIRQYVDMFSIKVIRDFPAFHLSFLQQSLQNHEKLKANYAISLVFLCGYLMCESPLLGQGLFDKVVVFTTSHIAYLRSVSQYFCYLYLSRHESQRDRQPFFQALHLYLAQNKESISLRQKY